MFFIIEALNVGIIEKISYKQYDTFELINPLCCIYLKIKNIKLFFLSFGSSFFFFYKKNSYQHSFFHHIILN